MYRYRSWFYCGSGFGNVVKKTGRFAVIRVDIRLPLPAFDLEIDFTTTSQMTGVFGPSGSGKTSLLESLCGLRSRVTGTISINNRIVLDGSLSLSPESRNIGYVPQDLLLFPHLSAGQNLMAGSRRAMASGLDAAVIRNKVIELLELSPLLPQPVQFLSGGERQRVSLGRALCSGPQLLVLDEPLASLDIPLARKIIPFLRRVRENFNIPALLVSHDPFELQALCEEVLVMDKGFIIRRGSPAHIFTDPGFLAMAPERRFENLIHCRGVSQRGATLKVRFNKSETFFTVEAPFIENPENKSFLLGVPAREIILSPDLPGRLSARNTVSATITEIQQTAAGIRVQTAIGDPPSQTLAVEITEEALSELGLKKGSEVFLIVKARSCRLYEI